MSGYNLNREYKRLFNNPYPFYVPGVGLVNKDFIPPTEGQEGYEVWKEFLADMDKN